jgi:CDP-glucose 4,6-dehydratase
MFKNTYKDRRVFITGHTGFKGSWLTAWLLEMGAKVTGYSLDIPTQPSHFEALGIHHKVNHIQADIRDKGSLEKALNQSCPEIIFHLAAQPLVFDSYERPAETFETNVLGTVNLLDCLRFLPKTKAAVFVTSDKCYENHEWVWGYRENDRLGGKDPYSASKACAEITCHAYMKSFFHGSGPRIATARAGNVIGGGDWAKNRLVPDCIRAWSANDSIVMRNPNSTRPWQHVLEPLSGYLTLGQKLHDEENGLYKNQAYNFGPEARSSQTVYNLVTAIARFWPDAKETIQNNNHEINKPESSLLHLNCEKSLQVLRWKPCLSFDQTTQMTGEWYKNFYDRNNNLTFQTTTGQIKYYIKQASTLNLEWAK